MRLVIVESPTKAKTIRKFLGSEYRVMSSMGHVRDLPESAADIPAAYKKEPWARLGVQVEKDFEPLYVVQRGKEKILAEIKRALKTAEAIYLATDEDREGESISWHLLQLLRPSVPVHRMAFHEITKSAIASALEHPRNIDEHLVRAQETRRILDRLVGYGISPVLWKKIAFGLSAGRVQSAALKAIVDRERARLAFSKSFYWDTLATLKKSSMNFEARLISIKGKRVATSKDFNEQTGSLKMNDGSLICLDETDAARISEETKKERWIVQETSQKIFNRKPAPPFTTSTFQQEANRKLGLSSQESMHLAQTLYEHGYITYMRTDSVVLSEEATEAARRMVRGRFDESFLPSQPRRYVTTSKGAQEAHEAIRPSLNFMPPTESGLEGKELAVYELIWMRTLASQMKDAEQIRMTALFRVHDYQFFASGLRILFPGFLRAYVEGTDDPLQFLEEKEHPLPELSEGETVLCLDVLPIAHETKPPARFTEAGLVQYMEKVGIGRPSTYATTIKTLLDRAYIQKLQQALIPTFTAFAVIQLMEKFFADFVDADFTSLMEASLDQIAEGKEEWLPYLKRFYLGDNGLASRIEKRTEDIDASQAKIIHLPQLQDVDVRVGKYGAYLEMRHPRSQLETKISLPPNFVPVDLTKDSIESLLNQVQQGPTNLGQDHASGKDILLKTGSFGPYLQLGEAEGRDKPKRVSIPKNIPLETLNYEKAIRLLSLPRLLGMHPEKGSEVRAGLGRFGPYVVCEDEFRSLKPEDNVLTIPLARALELLSQPKSLRRGTSKASMRSLGLYPGDEKPVELFEGEYGLYVKHAKTNASVPKGVTADQVTLEQAATWLAKKKEKRRRKLK